MAPWIAFPIALVVSLIAERLGGLRPRAAWAAAIIGGLSLWKGGVFAALAVVFFVAVASLATRMNQTSEDRQGRSPRQILANGLPAALGIVLGSPAFFLGALATALADTLATEMGARAPRAWHPVRGRVPSGTSGAISPVGTAALVLGALGFWPWAVMFQISPLAVVLGGVAGAFVDTAVGVLVEDRFPWWGNNLTNLLATSAGGLLAAVLSMS